MSIIRPDFHYPNWEALVKIGTQQAIRLERRTVLGLAVGALLAPHMIKPLTAHASEDQFTLESPTQLGKRRIFSDLPTVSGDLTYALREDLVEKFAVASQKIGASVMAEDTYVDPIHDLVTHTEIHYEIEEEERPFFLQMTAGNLQRPFQGTIASLRRLSVAEFLDISKIALHWQEGRLTDLIPYSNDGTSIPYYFRTVRSKPAD